MNTSTDKKYPQGTIDTNKMFGLPVNNGEKTQAPNTVLDAHFPPALPIEQKSKANGKTHSDPVSTPKQTEAKTDVLNAGEEKKQNAAVKIFTAVFPYIAVFAVGLLLYFFFFTKINFAEILKSRPNAAILTTKDSEAEKYKNQNLPAYKQWISGYYFEVSDSKVTDPDADNSGNGLTNFQKYLLGLNPKAYDTLGLGMADSEALSEGLNPQTGSALSETQKKTIEKYIDMEVVMNRFALANSRNQNRVAGAEISQNVPQNPSQNVGKKPITPRSNMELAQNSESSNAQAIPILGNTNPANQPRAQTSNPNSQAQPAAPVSGPVQQPVLENPYGLDIDTSIPARLEIPELGVNAPIIWTKSPNDFTKDLQSGVVHYPGTALPGEVGTTYISGHSSNYVWAKGNFNHVFTKLGDLPDNTSFKITVVQKNGRDAILHYVVTHRKEYSPRDGEQFRNTDRSLVALSTCWPVGSTQKRLVVFGELTQVEK